MLECTYWISPASLSSVSPNSIRELPAVEANSCMLGEPVPSPIDNSLAGESVPIPKFPELSILALSVSVPAAPVSNTNAPAPAPVSALTAKLAHKPSPPLS